MKTIIESNENYSVIDLTLEYENWTGKERYGVVSELEQSYVESTFASELEGYAPYIFMDSSFLDIRREFKNNEKKFEMRMLRDTTTFDYDSGLIEQEYPEIALPDFSKEVCEMIEFEKKLSCLKKKKKKRIIQFCKHQFTISEIAEEEGISKASASRTIARAIKKIKKFWKMG